MTRVKPHPKAWLAGLAGAGTVAATVLMATFSTGASASVATHSHARPHVLAKHVSPFGVGASRAARHVSRRPAAARAVVPNTPIEWVSNSLPVGTNRSCTNPGFSTISAALAVAPAGATVRVCAGTYQEQLAITQSVSINARGAVTLLLPATPSDTVTSCDTDGGAQPNQDVVDICGSAPGTQVTITGFTIEGNWPSDVCNDSLYGVAVLGGANLTMSNSTVEDIGGDPLTDGCQGGVGIEVGLAQTGTTADTGSATLTNDTVKSYQKNGITVDGTGSSATMTGVTTIGAGPSPAIAQNGIQISDAATATISGGHVSGNECSLTNVCGPDGFSQTQSCGILLYDAGQTSVSSVTVSGNDLGIYNLEGYAQTYYTPPATLPTQALTSLALANRYENAYFDEGNATFTSSHLSNGNQGIEMGQASYQTSPSVVSAMSDTITGAAQDAVFVGSDGVSGDPAINLTVGHSKLDTSNGGGVVNQSTSILNIKNDWWGDVNGPSGWNFGAGSSVSSDVDFFPWATSSALTAFETCTGPTNGRVTTSSTDIVLCAKKGTANNYLANTGSGSVLLVGNAGSDQLIGSSTGETWIVGHAGTGNNVINGNNGTGFIQERGDTNDTVLNASGYTVAPS